MVKDEKDNFYINQSNTREINPDGLLLIPELKAIAITGQEKLEKVEWRKTEYGPGKTVILNRNSLNDKFGKIFLHGVKAEASDIDLE